MLGRIKSFIKNYLVDKKAYQFFIRDWVRLTDLQHAGDMMATLRFSQNLQPRLVEGPRAKRIIVIAPHPDDESMGPGGTLLKEIDNGAEVWVVYLTFGDLTEKRERQEEATRIASHYKYKTIFFDYSAKAIPLSDPILSQLAGVINEVSPDVLFLPFCLDDHDDHRRASHLLLLAQRKGLLNCYFDVWAYQVYTVLFPNVLVDISDVVERKATMIKMWESQCKKRDWAHFTLGLNAFNQRFLLSGELPKYTETFFVLPVREYLDYCGRYFDPNPDDCYYHYPKTEPV